MTVGDEPEETGPRPLSFLGAVGWTLLAQVVAELAVMAAESFRGGAATDVVTLTTARVVGYALAFFLLLRVHEPESSIREVVALRVPRAIHVALAVLVGALLSPGASWLNEVLLRRFPLGEEQIRATEQVFAAETPVQRIVLFVSFGLVFPLAEELFFRGALFTPLLRRGRTQTVIFATAVFDAAFMVTTPAGAPALLLLVLALGVVRASSASVVPAALARVAFYAVSLWPYAVGRPEWDVPWQIAASTAAGAVVLLAVVTRVRPRAAEPTTETVR